MGGDFQDSPEKIRKESNNYKRPQVTLSCKAAAAPQKGDLHPENPRWLCVLRALLAFPHSTYSRLALRGCAVGTSTQPRLMASSWLLPGDIWTLGLCFHYLLIKIHPSPDHGPFWMACASSAALNSGGHTGLQMQLPQVPPWNWIRLQRWSWKELRS